MIAKAISLIFNEVDRYYLIREIDNTLSGNFKEQYALQIGQTFITFRITLQAKRM